jgi:hypothetical protein
MPDNEKWTEWLLCSYFEANRTSQFRSAAAVTFRAIWLHLEWLRREKKLINAIRVNVGYMRARKIVRILVFLPCKGRDSSPLQENISKLFYLGDGGSHVLSSL